MMCNNLSWRCGITLSGKNAGGACHSAKITSPRLPRAMNDINRCLICREIVLSQFTIPRKLNLSQQKVAAAKIVGPSKLLSACADTWTTWISQIWGLILKNTANENSIRGHPSTESPGANNNFPTAIPLCFCRHGITPLLETFAPIAISNSATQCAILSPYFASTVIVDEA